LAQQEAAQADFNRGEAAKLNGGDLSRNQLYGPYGVAAFLDDNPLIVAPDELTIDFTAISHQYGAGLFQGIESDRVGLTSSREM